MKYKIPEEWKTDIGQTTEVSEETRRLWHQFMNVVGEEEERRALSGDRSLPSWLDTRQTRTIKYRIV